VADHLEQQIESLRIFPNLDVRLLRGSFVDGIERLKTEIPGPFSGAQPLFVFIDPFGAKGVPFSIVRDILGSPHSEVLVNLDADAIVRILEAGAAASHDRSLTEIFGDDSWRGSLSGLVSFRDQVLAVVELYKTHLLAVPGVRYVYSFEMLTAKKQVGKVGYFLVFASQHRLGLVKMKEAMRTVDQQGSYQFSNALVGQLAMFRYDRPENHSPLLYRKFVGRGQVSYSEIDDFALLESPFTNPKAMLSSLEARGKLNVISANPKRRRGTFKDGTILAIEFLEGETDG